MGNLPSDAINAGIALAAIIVYGLIWIVSRELSRFAQVLARLLPLMLVVPAMLLAQLLNAPPKPKAPTAEVKGAVQPAQRAAELPKPAAADSKPEAKSDAKSGAPAEQQAGATPQRTDVALPARDTAAMPITPTPASLPEPPVERTTTEARRAPRAADTEPALPIPAAQISPPAEPTSDAAKTDPASNPDGTRAERPASPAPVPPAETASPPERKAEAATPPQPASGEEPVKRTEPNSPSATPQDVAPAGPRPGEHAQRAGDWDIVPVFYGTDRRRTDDADIRQRYSSDRGGRLEFGNALVTVPRSHQVPNIERPFAIRQPYVQVGVYAPAEDPKQHFTVKELRSLTREEFIALARERILGGHAFKDQAIVFVHGTNTEFDTALYRSAQMAYDLKFDGATFLYSWPSSGDAIGYAYDRESSVQAEPYLRDFLHTVLHDTGTKSVSVIAHSMGNLPLLRVLQVLGPQLPDGVRLNQIILAAPDVDRDVFAALAATITPYGRGVTLYCSSNDRAMAAARGVTGGIPRAGDVSAEGPMVLAGIDTIDISQTSTEYLALNHSSYAANSALRDDIGLLLRTGERRPDARLPILQRVATPKGDFWRYPAVP